MDHSVATYISGRIILGLRDHADIQCLCDRLQFLCSEFDILLSEPQDVLQVTTHGHGFTRGHNKQQGCVRPAHNLRLQKTNSRTEKQARNRIIQTVIRGVYFTIIFLDLHELLEHLHDHVLVQLALLVHLSAVLAVLPLANNQGFVDLRSVDHVFHERVAVEDR